MRLEQDVSTAEKVYDANFNSIKVRLEPFNAVITGQDNEFQFHKGAIRTALESDKKYFDGISIP